MSGNVDHYKKVGPFHEDELETWENLICDEVFYPLKTRYVKLQVLRLDNEARTFNIPQMGRYPQMGAIPKHEPIYFCIHFYPRV